MCKNSAILFYGKYFDEKQPVNCRINTGNKTTSYHTIKETLQAMKRLPIGSKNTLKQTLQK